MQHFGNYNYSLRKIARKNDKNGPKITKNCAKIILFFLYIFRIFFKFWVWWIDGESRRGMAASK